MYGFDKRCNADQKLMEHMPVCFENGGQKVDLPSEEEKFIQFRDIEKQMELPFVIYADFESILPEIEDDSTTNTKKINKHEACGFTFTTISPFYDPKTVSYRGPDAGEKFLHKIVKEETRVMQLIKDANIDIIMIPKLEENFQNATVCHICEEAFCEQDLEWILEGQIFR